MTCTKNEKTHGDVKKKKKIEEEGFYVKIEKKKKKLQCEWS